MNDSLCSLASEPEAEDCSWRRWTRFDPRWLEQSKLLNGIPHTTWLVMSETAAWSWHTTQYELQDCLAQVPVIRLPENRKKASRESSVNSTSPLCWVCALVKDAMAGLKQQAATSRAGARAGGLAAEAESQHLTKLALIARHNPLQKQSENLKNN